MFTGQSSVAYCTEESLQHPHNGGRQRCTSLVNVSILFYSMYHSVGQVMPDVNRVLDHMQQFSEVSTTVTIELYQCTVLCNRV